MKNKQLLASEFFSANSKRHYFIDLKRADNNSRYIQLTRSEQQNDGSYKRWSFVVFEDHLPEFLGAMRSVFQAAAYQYEGYQTVYDMAEEYKSAKGIKAMPEDARPREKLFSKGASRLTTEELLAILVGSGTPRESAVELGKRIYDGHGGRPHLLKQCSYSSLCKFKGMGVAKASAILAAIELAHRIYTPAPEFKTVYLVKKPGDAGDEPAYFLNS
ncbi:hypothetical protein ASU31_10650 [Pedobacter ginsenosidimutans]|uniref:UPF0758 domain-containing protein n=1 Tax=Pedobacter ginsenosidimutans TaxID=687842 RepID=A0A0T5VQ05_9SPHI|nr:UPF0758 domain-containing protein [Pedobacter ginsenosidimutans]KRT15959.1 hypothetical protein ASU31_10650 [Pedobacter ginsenosidimutans]